MPNAAADANSEQWLVHIANMLGAEASGMLTIHPDGSHSLIGNGHTESVLNNPLQSTAKYRNFGWSDCRRLVLAM